MTLRTFASVAAALSLAAAASAHDFWIRPSTFAPAASARVELDLRIGDDYPGESFPRRDAIIERFEAVRAVDGVAHPVVGLDGQSPAGRFAAPQSGVYLVVYRNRPSRAELKAAHFESYLREKGLEKIIEHRRRAGTSDQPARELFSRCAKVVLACGLSESEPVGFDRRTGLRLELIPASDPTRLSPDADSTFTLELDGKPCPGILLIASSVEHPQAKVEARTDDNGRAVLRMNRPGAWVITGVEMLAAPKGADADWESLWASLTVRVAEPASAPAPSPKLDAKAPAPERSPN